LAGLVLFGFNCSGFGFDFGDKTKIMIILSYYATMMHYFFSLVLVLEFQEQGRPRFVCIQMFQKKSTIPFNDSIDDQHMFNFMQMDDISYNMNISFFKSCFIFS
jgi:hypothetical protein